MKRISSTSSMGRPGPGLPTLTPQNLFAAGITINGCMVIPARLDSRPPIGAVPQMAELHGIRIPLDLARQDRVDPRDINHMPAVRHAVTLVWRNGPDPIDLFPDGQIINNGADTQIDYEPIPIEEQGELGPIIE